MKRVVSLFEKASHSWQVVARDPSRPNHLIDTNEYLVSSGNEALLTDPGGQEIFPAVFSAIASAANPEAITTIFASHQDPDVISSLSLWLAYKPSLRCYVSWLWCSFIPHFGGDETTLVPVPDEGMPLTVGSVGLELIPAHYLHSSGNHHLYDPEARILFSGDVGAALIPPEQDSLFVERFDDHIKFAEGFHRRWMGSAEAKRSWCERVSQLKIDMLCPQHGAIYRGRDVERFITWFDSLQVGVLRRR